jgi:hypothetical protein
VRAPAPAPPRGRTLTIVHPASVLLHAPGGGFAPVAPDGLGEDDGNYLFFRPPALPFFNPSRPARFSQPGRSRANKRDDLENGLSLGNREGRTWLFDSLRAPTGRNAECQPGGTVLQPSTQRWAACGMKCFSSSLRCPLLLDEV